MFSKWKKIIEYLQCIFFLDTYVESSRRVNFIRDKKIYKYTENVLYL